MLPGRCDSLFPLSRSNGPKSGVSKMLGFRQPRLITMSVPDGFAQLNDNAVTLFAAPTEEAPQLGPTGMVTPRCCFGCAHSQ